MICVNDLEIVGYAEKLRKGTVPRKVAPVFRCRKRQEAYVFPPFRLIDDQVVDAIEGDETDFKALLGEGRVTAIEPPMDAQPSAILWIDEDLNPHYGPHDQVLDELHELAKQRYEEARQAFERGEYDQAQELARHAFAANENDWSALALQVAVDEIKGDRDGKEVLREIATDIATSLEDFDEKVRN